MARSGLKELLKKVKTAEDIERIKPDIKKVLRKINAADLAIAEQELIGEETTLEEVRKLCGPHLELIREELMRDERKLDPLHPLRILKDEHEIILRNLDKLSGIIERANAVKNFSDLSGELEELKDVARVLVEAEIHHKREEDVLFHELEREGVSGPPMVMRMEHAELRSRKHALKELASDPMGRSYDDFVSRLNEVGGHIVQSLNDHIFKENNILYPMALQIIPEEMWREMKVEFDRIGYCCFTPTVKPEHDD